MLKKYSGCYSSDSCSVSLYHLGKAATRLKGRLQECRFAVILVANKDFKRHRFIIDGCDDESGQALPVDGIDEQVVVPVRLAIIVVEMQDKQAVEEIFKRRHAIIAEVGVAGVVAEADKFGRML